MGLVIGVVAFPFKVPLEQVQHLAAAFGRNGLGKRDLG
jgi:hypothetical protein